ncbi:hypothetical protein QZH41_019592 [Actinostola sp. cb2023]|nr:hypothetical protein QZH41_019592 [Actinostola sp. cb2023]
MSKSVKSHFVPFQILDFISGITCGPLWVHLRAGSQMIPGPQMIPRLDRVEYETVHDQILAANDAVNKRRMAEMASKPENINLKEGTVNENAVAKLLRLYQGDIKLDPELREELNAPRNRKFKRNAVRSRTSLWVSRIIPYYVPPNMRHIISNLNIAINEFHKHTCLRFVPRHGQRTYISFDESDGCSSRIGRRFWPPEKQTISLAGMCNFPGIIIHELMHAIDKGCFRTR